MVLLNSQLFIDSIYSWTVAPFLFFQFQHSLLYFAPNRVILLLVPFGSETENDEGCKGQSPFPAEVFIAE